MIHTPKVVTKPKCQNLKYVQKRCFGAKLLPRKRCNGFIRSTIFWVFFRSLVDFEGHCIDKIHTILIWSRSFFSTIRSKIRNRIDRNLYPTVLDDVIEIFDQTECSVWWKKSSSDTNVNFIVKMSTSCRKYRPLMYWPRPWSWYRLE